MKTIKKLLALLLVLVVITSCAQTGVDDPEVGEEQDTQEQSPDTSTDGDGVELTIQQVNQWLNTSADIGPGTKANAIAVVPINHVE